MELNERYTLLMICHREYDISYAKHVNSKTYYKRNETFDDRVKVPRFITNQSLQNKNIYTQDIEKDMIYFQVIFYKNI